MLKRISYLKNFGKFSSWICRAASDWNGEFAPLTLIYGENGSGKSTLSTLFRSLALSQPDLMIGKKTRGVSALPEAVLEFGDEKVLFTDGRWQHNDKLQLPGIEVFDMRFVYENVHTGFHVDAAHKRQLHSFVIGEENMALSREIAEIDEQLKELSRQSKLKEEQIKAMINGKVSVESFVELAPDEDIFSKVERQHKLIGIIEHSNLLLQTPQLSLLQFPALPLSEIEAFLKTDFENVANEAEQQINKHLGAHFDEKGKTWLEQGLGYVKEEQCPFCSADMTGSDLLRTYRNFFSNAYSEFTQKIQKQADDLLQGFSQATLLMIRKALLNNRPLIEFWKAHIPQPIPVIDDETLENNWMAFAVPFSEWLRRKKNAPADALALPAELKKLFVPLADAIVRLEEYNRSAHEFNLLIQGTRVKIEKADIETEKTRLAHYRNLQIRYAEPVQEWCETYQSLKKQKEKLDQQKDEKRKLHKKNMELFMERFGSNINRYLGDFTDDFKIIQLKTNYMGGKANVNYHLEVNGVLTDLGSHETSPQKASFGNTLSEGDKAALAFAFFMSKLSVHAAELKHQLIVFDDPVSNLDERRLQATAGRIRSLQEKTGAQVIVLTHNKPFAALLEKHSLKLKIEQTEQGSALVKA